MFAQNRRPILIPWKEKLNLLFLFVGTSLWAGVWLAASMQEKAVCFTRDDLQWHSPAYSWAGSHSATNSGPVQLALGSSCSRTRFSNYCYPTPYNNHLCPSSLVQKTWVFTLHPQFSTRANLPPGDVWQCLETFGCHSCGCTGTEEAEASMSLNIPHCTEQLLPSRMSISGALSLCSSLLLLQDSASQILSTSNSTLCLLNEETAVPCLDSPSFAVDQKVPLGR